MAKIKFLKAQISGSNPSYFFCVRARRTIDEKWQKHVVDTSHLQNRFFSEQKYNNVYLNSFSDVKPILNDSKKTTVYIRDLEKLNLALVVYVVLSSSQFQVMTQSPKKLMCPLNIIKSDAKIIISILLPRVNQNICVGVHKTS